MTTSNNSLNANSIKAVILAGGSGTRLWPLSRLQLPKQFLKLQGDKTLLQATVDRLDPLVQSEDVLIVTGAGHAKGEAYNSLRDFETLLEPAGRNTAPAIALAAAWLQDKNVDEDPVMVVLPADHIIQDKEAFQQALQEAVKVAAASRLVTFGIKPTRPDTGFGYIKTKKTSKKYNSDQACTVERFTEKPSLELAKEYVKQDDYFWNSGMFVWKASTILDEIKTHLPEVYTIVERIRELWNGGESLKSVIDEHFMSMPNISIDYGVLEKSSNVELIPCDMGWSDVGSWDAVYDIAEYDESGNVLEGRVIAKDCKNSLIHSNDRLVTAVGLNDLCIIETPDAVLVTNRGSTQRVREVVDLLKQNNATEHIFHRTVQRPWGSYTVLEEQPGFKMKRITVGPGSSLSLQRHQHRSEHWVVVSGTATVTRDEEILTITKNQSTYIPIGMKHRLENRGKIPLELIEVQVGEYLDEDDIERFEDHYDRVEK